MGPGIFSRGARQKRQRIWRWRRARTKPEGKSVQITPHYRRGVAAWSSPAAQDTRSHAVAGGVRGGGGCSEVSWKVETLGETHRKFRSRQRRRPSVFHRFGVGLSRDFIWIFAVLKDSPIEGDSQDFFPLFSQCLSHGISFFPLYFVVPDALFMRLLML